MAAPSNTDLAHHILELARIVKVVCAGVTRWHPSSEADEINTWAARELDKLRAALEQE